MQLTRFTVGAFQVNTYLITDPATGAQAIVDTGETEELAEALEALSPAPKIELILLTHGHIDHAGALSSLQARWPVPTYLGRLDEPLLKMLPEQRRMLGVPGPELPLGKIDHWLDDGDTVQLGETTLSYLGTPGHTPGQGCFYDDTDILVGDTLFAGSVGRVDLPLASPAAMQESLRKLFELPGHLRVHSGHGPPTTLQEELAHNPFLGYLRAERGMSGGRGFNLF